MKKNLILLINILITLIILSLLHNLSLNKNIKKISVNNKKLNKAFENYFETKVKVENKHATTKDMLDKNIDNGNTNSPDYFTQKVFKHVDAILTDLQIQSESPRLPQDGGITKMDGFDYIEFDLIITDCSFEKFGKFVNRLEKSDKIFIIDRFEFENRLDRRIQKAIKDGAFPGKDITMRIWAVNLNKSTVTNNTNQKDDKKGAKK